MTGFELEAPDDTRPLGWAADKLGELSDDIVIQNGIKRMSVAEVVVEIRKMAEAFDDAQEWLDD